MHPRCHNCNSSNLENLYTAPAFDSTPHGRAQNFDLCRCGDCRLVNTALTASGFDSRDEPVYTEAYYGSSSSKFLAFIEALLQYSTALQARRILKLWRRDHNARRSPAVLDIGCGRGLLLRAFQAEGALVIGLEREEFPIDHSCDDIVHSGSITDEEYKNKKFDIIILWHVLEHLSALGELLDEISSHLSGDGLLVLAVPNFGSLQQRLFSKYWFHLDLPRHLVHFESDWLVSELLNRGYSIERESHVDLVQNTFGFIQSALNLVNSTNQNAYYGLLKHGKKLRGGTLLPFLGWSLLSIALSPLALLELILSTFLHRGATVQVFARPGKKR